MLLAVIFSAVYVAVELEAYRILIWLATVSALLMITLQLTYFLKLFFSTYFQWQGAGLVITISITVLLLLVALFYKLATRLNQWLSSTVWIHAAQWVSSLFLALSFTLVYAYFLRFMTGSGIIPPSYSEGSFPMKVLLSFCQTGDHVQALATDFIQSLRTMSSDAFSVEPTEKSR
jgi:hypothetical protein